MASYNKVILMGNLTRDPHLRTLPSGTAVCEFGLAVNRTWTDAGGTKQEEVLFIDCTAFGRVAETLGQYLAKGRPIHVEGRLKLDRWEQEGQPPLQRSKVRVVVEQFRFVDSVRSQPNGQQEPAQSPQAEEAPTQQPPERRTAKRRTGRRAAAPTPPAQPVGAAAGGSGDDIPF